MKFKMNQNIVIVNVSPYNMFGHNKKIAKFVEIEIIEEIKNVPGEFTSKTKHTGYIGKGTDGYQYSYNYPYANEGFGDTVWTRYCENDRFERLAKVEKDQMIKDYIWFDITDYHCPKEASFCKGKDYIKYCEIHKRHYYLVNKCFHCTFNIDTKDCLNNMEENSWLGWY